MPLLVGTDSSFKFAFLADPLLPVGGDAIPGALVALSN